MTYFMPHRTYRLTLKPDAVWEYRYRDIGGRFVFAIDPSDIVSEVEAKKLPSAVGSVVSDGKRVFMKVHPAGHDNACWIRTGDDGFGWRTTEDMTHDLRGKPITVVYDPSESV